MSCVYWGMPIKSKFQCSIVFVPIQLHSIGFDKCSIASIPYFLSKSKRCNYP